jgi:hypothetical protein
VSNKTAGVGHFQIPTAPAAGVSVVSGSANAYTGTAVVLSASTAAIYITGVHVESAAALAATYISVQLMIGAGGAETVIGQYLVPLSTGSTVALGFRPIWPPIPVANGTRLSVKTADSVGSKTTLVSVECIAQSNVVDDGITVGTVNLVNTVTTVTNQLTAAAIATGVWQDATAGDFTVASSIGKSLYIANVAPGAAGGHMISGTNAGTTTFGALTITGVTTFTGNVVLSDGLTISAPSTGNRAGLDIAGNGSGAGLKITGGATGIGMNVIGGGTSGDGIKVTTTSGHGLNLAPVGTSMHGLLATGGNGGTSDGIKAAAGTGGVDLRAAITGNVTGNLSGSVGSVTGAVGSVTGAVGSVTGAVGSVTGNVGGNVVGSVASVTGAVGSVTGLTASNLDAAVSSRMATYTQPSGFLAATFPTGTVANTTNITAGTITTVTNLTNAPTAGDFTSTMKTSIGTAVAASAVASVTGNVGGNVAGSVGSVTGLTASNLDVAVSSRLATSSYTAPDNARPTNFTSLAITAGGAVTAGTVSDKTGYSLTTAPLDAAGTRSAIGMASANLDTQLAALDADVLTRLPSSSYTAPDNASVAAIKTKTDSLNFTVAGKLDVNVMVINGVTVSGSGTALSPWSPA